MKNSFDWQHLFFVEVSPVALTIQAHSNAKWTLNECAQAKFFTVSSYRVLIPHSRLSAQCITKSSSGAAQLMAFRVIDQMTVLIAKTYRLELELVSKSEQAIIKTNKKKIGRWYSPCRCRIQTEFRTISSLSKESASSPTPTPTSRLLSADSVLLLFLNKMR